MGITDVADFLSGAPTPPHGKHVNAALEVLQRTGALKGDHLTALGCHLAALPADLRCGKILVYGSVFGCLENALIIAGILSARSPFYSPPDKREESKSSRASFSHGNGDVIADFSAYCEWERMSKTCSRNEVRSWCNAHFLSPQTLAEIFSNRAQYLSTLKETGFVPLDYVDAQTDTAGLNLNNNNLPILRALVAGSLYPQMARIVWPEARWVASSSGAVSQDPEARTIKYFTQDAGRVFVHPGSVLFDAQSFSGQSNYISFFSSMTTSKSFIRDLTPFNVHILLMFCGTIEVDTAGRGILVDGWLRVKGWARIGILLSRLRGVLDELLQQKMEDPSIVLGRHELVQAVVRLVENNGMDN